MTRRGLYANLGQIQDYATQQSLRLIYERLAELDTKIGTDADELIRIASQLDRSKRLERICSRHTAQIESITLLNAFGLPFGEFPPDFGFGGGGFTYEGDPVTFGGCSSDKISPSSITWLHDNASSWPKTSQISSITIGPNVVSFPHSKAGQWPTFTVGGTLLEGNPWFFANIGGKWYGATWEWLRPGQTSKSLQPNEYGPHIKRSPMDTWEPVAGELVGFMVSTRARDGVSSGDERSSICSFNFPDLKKVVNAPAPGGGSGGSFEPGDLPPPGSRLNVVSDVARDFPNYLQNSCQSAGGTWQFMDEVVRRLRQESPRWGYNLKRGGPDLSEDVVDYYYGADISAAQGSTKVYIYDIIGGHCGPNPSPAWIDQTAETLRQGSIGRWKFPR